MNAPDSVKQDTWAAFIEMRRLKGQRAPITEFALKRICLKLEDIHRQGYDADFCLAEAVIHGWTSVYLVRDCPRRQMTPAEQDASGRIARMAAGSIASITRAK